MPATPSMDIKTRLTKIHEATESIQSGWLARPPLGHPHRSTWERACREEIRKLKELLRGVKESIAVPPLVLALLVEHARAVAAKEKEYNYEALDPENSIDKAGAYYTRDERYKVRVKKTGWWTDLEASSKSSAAAGGTRRANQADPSAARKDDHASASGQTAPSQREASAVASGPEPVLAVKHPDMGRTTRARTRAQIKPEASLPSDTPAPPAVRRPAPKLAPPTQLKTSIPSESTESGSRDVSLTPAPGAQDEGVWDPASKQIVDEWLISLKKCKKCHAAGHTCRVNLVHGVACNRCTNSSVGCSFAAKQPPSGPKWTYDQRRWILVYWAQNAQANTSHPSEVPARFPSNFAPPGWFLDGLQAARGRDAETTRKRSKRLRADSPIGQKRRPVIAPTTDSGEDSPSLKVATPAKRKRAKRSKITPINVDLYSDDGDVEGHDSGADKVEGVGDFRPIKRARTDSRASSAVPHARGPWKHLRNVEHMLRDVPATSDAPAAGRGAAGLSSVTEAEYAPDFDHPLVPMTGLHPHPILPALARPAPSFAVISPTCTGPQLVNKINANNAASETGLAALWEAVGRQQFAHDSFKAEARRELMELKSALSAASLASDSVAHERDILRQESEEKSTEIERLRSQVLALQASLDTAQRPRPSPVVVAHDAGAGDTQPILVDPPKTTALARTLPPLASERPDAHRTERSDAAAAYDHAVVSVSHSSQIVDVTAATLPVRDEPRAGSPAGGAASHRDQPPLEVQDEPRCKRADSPPAVYSTTANRHSSGPLDEPSGGQRSQDAMGHPGSPQMASVPSSPSALPTQSDGLRELSAYASSSSSASPKSVRGLGDELREPHSDNAAGEETTALMETTGEQEATEEGELVET